MVYSLLKWVIRWSLWIYFKRIKWVGLENIPKSGALLFLSNHQNALLDVLLIATQRKRKPYFLARADVFKASFLHPLWRFLRMLPVYRIRDGKNQLSNNNLTFTKAAELLANQQSLALFPEANHHLDRRVRNISKGFTRILKICMDSNPCLPISIIAVGQNYKQATQISDCTSIYFGKPILLSDFTKNVNWEKQLTAVVAEALKTLTTHIDNAEEYEKITTRLQSMHYDFTQPIRVDNLKALEKVNRKPFKSEFLIPSILLYLWNLPHYLLWRYWIKPMIPEREFISTFRYGYCLLIYPITYLSILLYCSFLESKIIDGLFWIFLHFIVNLILIKIGVKNKPLFHKQLF